MFNVFGFPFTPKYAATLQISQTFFRLSSYATISFKLPFSLFHEYQGTQQQSSKSKHLLHISGTACTKESTYSLAIYQPATGIGEFIEWISVLLQGSSLLLITKTTLAIWGMKGNCLMCR